MKGGSPSQISDTKWLFAELGSLRTANIALNSPCECDTWATVAENHRRIVSATDFEVSSVIAASS
jgi:hypothetical protein